jgi:5-(carboxyamino)imidazole ribonucleotide mutase
MRHATDILDELGIGYDVRVVSAHRTPHLLADYATWAEQQNIEVIVAGAGGAAHLPGMLAAHTVIPVLAVPVRSSALSGMDSLLSIVQMPRGVPVGTLAIGPAGAANAGLLAAAIVSTARPELRAALRAWRAAQTAAVVADPDPRVQRTSSDG